MHRLQRCHCSLYRSVKQLKNDFVFAHGFARSTPVFARAELGRSAAHLKAGAGRDQIAEPRPNGKAGRGGVSPPPRAPESPAPKINKGSGRCHRGRCCHRPAAAVRQPAELHPVHTRPGRWLLPRAPALGGHPESPRRQRWTGVGGGGGSSLPPAPPKSLNTYPPQRPNTPTPQHTAPPLLNAMHVQGRGRGSAGPAAGGREGVCREETSAEAEEGRRRCWREGRCRREDARAAAGGSGAIGPPPHLAALLVVKADHHDVQNGPPRGAIAAPPGLLHGQPPRARTTTTSTATGGGRVTGGPRAAGDPWISGVSRGAA